MVASHYMAGLLAAVSSVFFASVNGHMIMVTPHPYGPDSLDNSPLDASGSDFPCKLRGDSTWGAPVSANNFAIGATQELSFKGSAVHGGGSCQISLTTDAQPDKNSKWEVIHSIEGGCPSNVTGNLDANPDGSGAAVFQFSIPEGVSTGNYTLAWTWFNKVGNREMYMNCAPITVTSGSSSKRNQVKSPVSKKRATSFPTMFVANIDGVSNGCATTEGVDTVFPDPGTSVDKEASSFNPNFGPPTGCTDSSSSSSNTSSSSGSTTSAAGSDSSSAASTASASAGVFASGAASSSSVAASSPAATATAATSGVSPASSNTSSASSSSSTSTSSGSQSGACSDEGAYACSSDGSSFQRCASGQWSASISMATGTSCTPGVSDTLTMNATKLKRAEAVRHAHVRRTNHAWGL